MDKLAPVGRLFFAVSLAAFGVQQFLFGDFVPGRAPAWPEGVPGRLVWAWLSGAALIAIGIAIAAGRKTWIAAFAAVGLIFVWAVLRNVPLAIADKGYGGAWTNLGKGLVLTGGVLAVAALCKPNPAFTWAGRLTLGAFMISSGIQHFLFPQFVKTLVPAWIPPSQIFWTYFAAVALIAGGLGLMVPWTTRLAAFLSGLMIFLWVILLHVPRALAAPDAGQLRNEWTAVFEALAFAGLGFVLAKKDARRAS
jgi:uncharacterized membrane protein YphA (DoxX/SURF4 family)